ncbi:hypothetical protein EV659_108142 [Rhodothalassium salexigens DSM 2132]|uniref:Uncharacterized protein n=1 Tax=Rhodothalassium salexigens DSM 2132 TaxID=1188247 RepID=A0A4R2PD20_RHOSA|nr:hypothetical protein [Rhodothalassium salexigens]MBB4212168.1 hypothetical protein [Rhodothalassium salexigens DSM 2132]MBK1638165.1 hypothetical protein [Rhodothalassium salexigens DSM 2132]TCP33042.1 hypothetical protein EV659_108142 [Rhodothalassium salexigens DSM 2132]
MEDWQQPVAAILGNGPSLAQIDLHAFGDHIHTFGFNAAYRHWQRIDWHPTYYACLDTVVGLSHKDAIEAMLARADTLGIRQFFVRMNLASQLTGTPQAERVVAYERLVRQHPILERYATITTGSHAAIIAMLLGYKTVALFGVDLDYQPLDVAQTVSGNVLMTTQTPEQNPNYFFADYQQAGDLYHVPNPGRDLHLEAWGDTAAAAEALGARVINCNPASKLDRFERLAPERFFALAAEAR